MMNHRKQREQSKSPFASIIAGILFSCAFGAAWFFTGMRSWFFIFPLVFVGIMPIINGITMLSRKKKYDELSHSNGKLNIEKQILLVAKQNKGKVTPALVALNSDLPLEQVEKTLSDMAKKGYVEMHVTRGGRIEYIFHDFADQDDLLIE